MSDNQLVINWYPGHMAKAKRLLQEQIKRIDLILEVCDARLPYASRNPDLISLAGQKKHILLINKSDLADQSVNHEWLRYFRAHGTEAYLINSKLIRPKEITGLIESVAKNTVEKALQKGVRKTVRVMITGIPNVGKSTLINHVYGRTITQTGDRPGVTKSNQWVKISPYLELLDTPGLLWPRLNDQTGARRLCYIGCIKDDILNLSDLTIHLLEDLCDLIPDKMIERFHIRDTSLKGIDLLDAVCIGRGWLLKGMQYDYDRCFRIVLDEFRAGKLGRISLERPAETTDGVKNND